MPGARRARPCRGASGRCMLPRRGGPAERLSRLAEGLSVKSPDISAESSNLFCCPMSSPLGRQSARPGWGAGPYRVRGYHTEWRGRRLLRTFTFRLVAKRVTLKMSASTWFRTRWDTLPTTRFGESYPAKGRNQSTGRQIRSGLGQRCPNDARELLLGCAENRIAVWRKPRRKLGCPNAAFRGA